MVCDGSLGLDGAKQQHRHVGVHEEDQHEQGANVVEGWQGNDQSCQQRLQTLQAPYIQQAYMDSSQVLNAC